MHQMAENILLEEMNINENNEINVGNSSFSNLINLSDDD